MRSGLRSTPPQTELRGLLLAIVASGVVLIAFVVQLARKERDNPARCPSGSIALGARCCGLAQTLERGRCTGAPRDCPAHLLLTETGCLLAPGKLSYVGGKLYFRTVDWEGSTPAADNQRADVAVPAFQLDVGEVTQKAYRVCNKAGTCPAPAVQKQPRHAPEEPGLAVAGVTARAAERYCLFAGGRLPTTSEWMFAASGGRKHARRYPWGQTGLVCRRSAFGLVDGPCASGARGPELTGMRPDGVSPEGAYDLVGNVAEITRSDAGKYEVCGGSYRSDLASELKSRSCRSFVAPARDIGFRCAYDTNSDP